MSTHAAEVAACYTAYGFTKPAEAGIPQAKWWWVGPANVSAASIQSAANIAPSGSDLSNALNLLDVSGGSLQSRGVIPLCLKVGVSLAS